MALLFPHGTENAMPVNLLWVEVNMHFDDDDLIGGKIYTASPNLIIDLFSA
jgi:hypothetical protein